jgi:hypothetical protein
VNVSPLVFQAPHPVSVKAPLHGIATFVFQLIFGEQMACTAFRLEAHPPPPPGGVPDTTVIPAGKANWYRSTYSAPDCIYVTLNVNVLFIPGTYVVCGLVTVMVMAALATVKVPIHSKQANQRFRTSLFDKIVKLLFFMSLEFVMS